jgi:hypothetical protein
MSTPTSNTAVTSTTSGSGLSIGLIVGVIVIAMIIIGVVVYVMKSRRNASGAAPSGPPTAANGLGAMNQGPNAVPRTNMNINAGRTTA